MSQKWTFSSDIIIFMYVCKVPIHFLNNEKCLLPFLMLPFLPGYVKLQQCFPPSGNQSSRRPFWILAIDLHCQWWDILVPAFTIYLPAPPTANLHELFYISPMLAWNALCSPDWPWFSTPLPQPLKLGATGMHFLIWHFTHFFFHLKVCLLDYEMSSFYS